MNRGKLGGVATLMAGVAYLVVLANAIWGHGEPQPSWLLILVFAAGTFVTVAILTALFRPQSLWSFPALFSVPLLTLSLFYMWDLFGLAIVSFPAV